MHIFVRVLGMNFSIITMDATEKLSPVYKVGDIVRTAEAFGPNPAGSVGIIYETYPSQDSEAHEVISVLLRNGHDIGSFNEEEQSECLTWIGHTDLTYTYTDPNQLMTDFRDGYFEQAIANAKVVSENAVVVNAEEQ